MIQHPQQLLKMTDFTSEVESNPSIEIDEVKGYKTYGGFKYHLKFPDEWILDEKEETGRDCWNCVGTCPEDTGYAKWRGLILGYCANCAEDYEGERGCGFLGFGVDRSHCEVSYLGDSAFDTYLKGEYLDDTGDISEWPEDTLENHFKLINEQQSGITDDDVYNTFSQEEYDGDTIRYAKIYPEDTMENYEEEEQQTFTCKNSLCKEQITLTPYHKCPCCHYLYCKNGCSKLALIGCVECYDCFYNDKCKECNTDIDRVNHQCPKCLKKCCRYCPDTELVHSSDFCRDCYEPDYEEQEYDYSEDDGQFEDDEDVFTYDSRTLKAFSPN